MSAKLLGAAFAADVRPHAFKLVLLKLVDAARDDGKRIFPSVATIAAAAGVSDRHTKRVLQGFVGAGLLTVVSKGGKGKGDTTEYTLNVAMLNRLATSHSVTFENGKGTIIAKGDMAAPIEERVTSEPLRVTPEPPNPLRDPLDSREGARAQGQVGQIPPSRLNLRPGDDAEAEKRFAALVAAYAPGAVGSIAKARPLFFALDAAAQDDSREALPRVRAGWRAENRSFTVALSTYLENRDWERFPKQQAAGKAPAEVPIRLGPYSRGVWALFARRYAAKRPVEGLLAWIRNGVTIPAATAPTPDEEAALAAVRVGSDEHLSWVDHCERLGFVLPKPDHAEYVFLPSGRPPDLPIRWKGYRLLMLVALRYRSRQWWWRLYQRGAPVADLLAAARRHEGVEQIEHGPLPLARETLAMVEVAPLTDQWNAWSIWFSAHRAHLELWPHGPIYTPTEYPPAVFEPERPDPIPDYEMLDAIGGEE